MAGDEMSRRDLLKLRRNHPALLTRHEATGMEFAPCRRLDRAGNISFQQNPFLGQAVRVRRGNRRQ